MAADVAHNDMAPKTKEALDWFRNVFAKDARNGEMDKKFFISIMAENKEFVRNFFRLLDNDDSESVCAQEFTGGMIKLSKGQEIAQKKIDKLVQMFAGFTNYSFVLDAYGFAKMCLDPKFSGRIFKLLGPDKKGCVEISSFLVCLDKLARTSVEQKWSDWVEKWFTRHASKDGHITKEQFLTYLNLPKTLFGERLFAVADTDGSGTVDVTELVSLINVLSQGSPKERLMLLFNIYDTDGDKCLCRAELLSALTSCLVDSKMNARLGLAEQLADVLYQTVDAGDNSDSLTFEKLEKFLEDYPHVTKNLTISLPHILNPKKKKRRKKTSEAGVGQLTKLIRRMSANKALVWYWVVYAAINLILFNVQASIYAKDHNVYVALARGGGICLNFNSAYIVVLMWRHIWTFVRSTRLSKYLPLDHAIEAHKITGYVIIGFSFLHTAMHVANFGTMTSSTNVTWEEYLFTPQKGIGWVGGASSITGWVLILILAAIVIAAHPCVRRKGHFQVFYWSHWLFVVWWAVLVIHCTHFWKWLVGPAAIYICEKIWQQVLQLRTKSTVIKRIQPLTSTVSLVTIERPDTFEFKSGDYIFVQIEEIAKFEWHPFTISSAPEQTDYLTLHVQAVGDWTKRLHALGENWPEDGDKEQAKDMLKPATAYHRLSWVSETSPMSLLSALQGKKHLADVDRVSISSDGERRNSAVHNRVWDVEGNFSSFRATPIKVSLDGPYGTPSSGVFRVDHAILIGAGIGVTPYASVLQSMRHRRRSKNTDTCLFWNNPGFYELTKVSKKVNFIWVTRTLETMEWLLHDLRELEEDQVDMTPEERYLDVSLHVTSALGQNDLRAVALHMALELCYKEDSRDPLSGLRTRIQPGRPDWKTLLGDIVGKAKGKTCVFYCGPPALEKILEKACLEFKISFRSENF